MSLFVKGRTKLYKAVAAVGLATFLPRDLNLPRLEVPQATPRRRTTTMNYQLQKQVHDAAEAKRLRRQARNLLMAGKTQEDML